MANDFNSAFATLPNAEIQDALDSLSDFDSTCLEQTHLEPQPERPTPLIPRRLASDFDFAKIPRRPWVLGTRLQRGLLSVLLAPGGVGKSTLMVSTAMSIALARPLTGEEVHEGGSAWIINNEDSQDELDRHIAALCINYGVSAAELRNSFFVNSGFERRVMVASRRVDGSIAQMPDVQAIIEQCKAHNVVYLGIDPFVSTHQASENSNDEIEQVASQFREIAHKANVSVELAHHVVKNSSGNSEAHAGIAEHGRGAGALIAAARIVSTLAQMSTKTADEMGIEPELRRRLVRLDNAKENQGLSKTSARWFKLESVRLPNGDGAEIPGDSVGVFAPFDMETFSNLKRTERRIQNDEAAEPARRSLAEFIGRRIKGLEAPIRDLVDSVMEREQVRERCAREKINAAIPEIPQWRSVEIDGQQWKLGQRKICVSQKRSPRVIVKQLVRSE